jgi:molybdopterin synthase catalytic subunit
MKIIHIAGLSGSGKSTLINDLIPALGAQGSVAVIKHLGHHSFELEPGKDTTMFFDAGADITVGIDAHKSVALLRTASLDEVLALLAGTGTDVVVIEGFKQRPFAKAVIGDLAAENVLVRDPTVQDIIANIDRFDTYRPPHTAGQRGIR